MTVNDATNGSHEPTIRFHVDGGDPQIRRILLHVLDAMREKGYDPIKQLVGYLLSGDPTYITSHARARNLIRTLERDRVLEELIKEFLRDEPPAEPRSLA